MSDDNEITQVPDELALLKDRASQLGIKFHPSIGVESLREKIATKLSGEDEAPAAVAAKAAEESDGQKRNRLRREMLALVRVRVTCMNPAKAEWDGEIFTCGNAATGAVRKYVPFNADEGWHIPKILLQMLRERQCQIFTSVRDARGNSVRKSKLIKEFAIEELPPLTKEELADLAQRQAIAKAID